MPQQERAFAAGSVSRRVRQTEPTIDADASTHSGRRPKVVRRSTRRSTTTTTAASGAARRSTTHASPVRPTLASRVHDVTATASRVVWYFVGQVRLLAVVLGLAQNVVGRGLATLQWLNDYPARVQFRRTTQRFLAVMNTTESYATFVEAAASLDHYCGVAKWMQDAPPAEHCNAVGLLVDATAAQHLVRTHNVEGMETFLCALLKRNAHGLMDAAVYRFFHSAPCCLEDYTDSIESLITAYAGLHRDGWSPTASAQGGAGADAHKQRTNAASPALRLRELRPCWVRLEAASGGTGAASPLHAVLRQPPEWTAAPHRVPSALPTIDVTSKIQHAWATQLRRVAAAGPPAPATAATAAPSRRTSAPACLYQLASSVASAAVPLTDTASIATGRTGYSASAGEDSTYLVSATAPTESEKVLTRVPTTVTECAPESRRAGELASASPPLSPLRLLGLREPTTSAVPDSFTSPECTPGPRPPRRLTSPTSFSAAAVTPAQPPAPAPQPTPEVALAQHVRTSCASLCSFLDGCATASQTVAPAAASVEHRVGVLRQVLRSFGRTALVLSGGASMGTYHAGVARALYEANVLPDIMCGSSAGSIIAAMICTKSPEELHAFMQSHVLSTEAMNMSPFGEDSGLLGKLKRFFETGFLMDVRTLIECMRGQCGDMTFLEAYQLSGKVLNVSVTRSQQQGAPSDRHALLNYVTAPDVVIWSAVSASCALPGLFTAVQLIEKPSLGAGAFAPYLPGELWCDGSVAQDIPRRSLIQLFNVNYLIVSQVNPYVIPFLQPPDSHHITAAGHSLLSRLWFTWVAACGWVLAVLFSLHLVHRSGRFEVLYLAFAQRYGGDLTIQPIDSVMTAVPDYMNLVNNPSADYISYVASRAQSRTWPLVTRIRLATCIERCLQREIRALETVAYGEAVM